MKEFGDLGENNWGFGSQHPGESTPTFNEFTKKDFKHKQIIMLGFQFLISYHNLLNVLITSLVNIKQTI